MTAPASGIAHIAHEEPLQLRDTAAAKARALAAFREGGTVVAACQAAGVSRRSWYNWFAEDPEFARAALDANEAIADELEAEAIQRAKDGSDSLIMFLLKARRPKVYRETHRIETVSPEVQECLRRTIGIIKEELPADQAETLLRRLDAVWGA
jgi:hypothetical protein